MIQYIVQPGDNLYSISQRFKTKVTILMQVNHLTDPQKIHPGQLLKIPLARSNNEAISRTVPNINQGTGFPNLTKGSTGPFVLLLQGQLSKLGFYKGNMDGLFTNITEGSVIQFQASRSLHATGQVDVNTWRHILDDVQGSQNAPPYHIKMLLSGLLVILSLDKSSYEPGELLNLSLMKINLSNETIQLSYNTSQRYDFKLSSSSGRTLWRWSDDKSFTQVLGKVSLSPGQVIRYTEQTTLPDSIENGTFHVFAWNTAKQINHIKLHVITTH
ncbi:MAG: LysM peptidoglycan-binding domain-containing protein [Clostridiales bacterium]|nr:LysM peptidoglycan-binding domain-containing protein [Clostridiales bacterium]